MSDLLAVLPELRRRWDWLTAAIGVAANASEPVWDLLLAAYQEAWRHYHTLHHIHYGFSQLDQFQRTEKELVHLSLALWFHDVVYKPQARDNEVASINITTTTLQCWPLSSLTLREITRLIHITKSHRANPLDELGHVFLDTDLAILSRDRAHYQRYAAQIRAEYAWVDEAAYRSGRIQVLKSFLTRPQIYFTRQFASREEQARQNLSWEIRQLQQSVL